MSSNTITKPKGSPLYMGLFYPDNEGNRKDMSEFTSMEMRVSKIGDYDAVSVYTLESLSEGESNKYNVLINPLLDLEPGRYKFDIHFINTNLPETNYVISDEFLPNLNILPIIE